MKYYISMIPYANMGPYKCLGEPDNCAFVYYTPKQSIKAIKTGRVIAAPVPVAALPDLLNTDMVEYIGEYGIAAERDVKSVLLFSHKPFEKLDRTNTIYVTNQSASSISLLYILLTSRENKMEIPMFTYQDNNPDAALYIGDQALLFAMNHSYRYVTDLAGKWYKEYSLPFVFARWVVSKSAPCKLKTTLYDWLGQLKKSDAELVEQSAPLEAKRLGISTQRMVTYLQGMHRVLGEKHLRGQELFLNKIAHPEISGPVKRLINTHVNLCTKNNRITRSKALELLTEEPLGLLMERAFERRRQLYPDNLVTFVKDTNPNNTNVCETKCTFCAFHRDGSDKDAYTLSPEELAEKIRVSENAGAATVLLQGGHNPKVGFEDWIACIRAIRKMCPDIHIHPFSPTEIYYMSIKEKLSVKEILQGLKMEGIQTIPGGGAEILVDRIRNRISPNKCSSDQWLDIMKQAHVMDFKTTATMMYGHMETPMDCVDHLFRLRDLQDKTYGFSSFIPWSFKPGNSTLSEIIPNPAHPAYYIRIIAVARLFLDNFDHIQSSWFSESENAGTLGLLAGADDFGGILIEENVLKTSGYVKQTSLEKVKKIIRDCRFTPALRDSFYNIIEIYSDDKS